MLDPLPKEDLPVLQLILKNTSLKKMLIKTAEAGSENSLPVLCSTRKFRVVFLR